MSTTTPSWGTVGPDSLCDSWYPTYPKVTTLLPFGSDPQFNNCYLYTGLETPGGQQGNEGYYYMLGYVYSEDVADKIFAKNGSCLISIPDSTVFGGGVGNDDNYENGEWICFSVKN